ncbi:ATP-dependent DNA helicase PIF1 [Pseudolycoriella hygida]|uniref:ATP-dependent DNA helicase n=1 Tax=Pseudolycoriella hygida TaxID=35572 RepID=A0A9Q0MMT3_9DIPT|nr:ATP-dependent DNA helicase PIF1 [Pseudolycoriella hygida]
MEFNDSTVNCAANIIWTDAQGQSIRKVTHKIATLKLVRNDLREMFIEVSTEKTKPIKLKLSSIAVHKKFMNEGKASIMFNNEKCTLFISNAPPGNLLLFLKTVFIKISGEKAIDPAVMQKKIRAHMLSGVPTKFEEISPISNTDLLRTKKLLGVSKASVTTPSPQKNRKRKMEDDVQKLPAPKKLSTAFLGEESATLNEEQNEVFQSCLKGHNVFFTGSAGTGKSFMLKKIISALPPEGTVAVASTGVAACLIGGVTLHAFAGIGDGEASLKRCYELASRPVISQAWRKCKRLIIDEISMVDGEYFDKIEAVARYIRRNDKPFGGIQLILCGDFLQLPPVTKSIQRNQPLSSAREKRFCFQSDSWNNSIGMSYELKIVHRQKDEQFVKMLNLLRIGLVNEDITKRLLATSIQQIESNGILATQLCSHTNDANSINESCLQKLEAASKVFHAEDSDIGSVKQLDSQVPAPGRLELKIGAQVMLLKNVNVSNGLVNGARGIVIGFHATYPSGEDITYKMKIEESDKKCCLDYYNK